MSTSSLIEFDMALCVDSGNCVILSSKVQKEKSDINNSIYSCVNRSLMDEGTIRHFIKMQRQEKAIHDAGGHVFKNIGKTFREFQLEEELRQTEQLERQRAAKIEELFSTIQSVALSETASSLVANVSSISEQLGELTRAKIIQLSSNLVYIKGVLDPVLKKLVTILNASASIEYGAQHEGTELEKFSVGVNHFGLTVFDQLRSGGIMTLGVSLIASGVGKGVSGLPLIVGGVVILVGEYIGESSSAKATNAMDKLNWKPQSGNNSAFRILKVNSTWCVDDLTRHNNVFDALDSLNNVNNSQICRWLDPLSCGVPSFTSHHHFGCGISVPGSFSPNSITVTNSLWNQTISPGPQLCTADLIALNAVRDSLGGVSIGGISSHTNNNITAKPQQYVTLLPNGLFTCEADTYSMDYDSTEAHVLTYVLLVLLAEEKLDIFFTYYTDDVRAKSECGNKVDLTQFLILFLKLEPTELLFTDLMRCSRIIDYQLKHILRAHMQKGIQNANKANKLAADTSTLSAFIEPVAVNVTKISSNHFRIEGATTSMQLHSEGNVYGEKVDEKEKLKAESSFIREGTITREEYYLLHNMSKPLIDANTVARGESDGELTWQYHVDTHLKNTSEFNFVTRGMSLVAILLDFRARGYTVNPAQHSYCEKLLTELPNKTSVFQNIPNYDVSRKCELNLNNAVTSRNNVVPINGGLNLARNKRFVNIIDDLGPLDRCVFRTASRNDHRERSFDHRLEHICAGCSVVLPTLARKIFEHKPLHNTVLCYCADCVSSTLTTLYVIPNMTELVNCNAFLQDQEKLVHVFNANPHLYCFFEMKYDTTASEEIVNESIRTIALYKIHKELSVNVTIPSVDSFTLQFKSLRNRAIKTMEFMTLSKVNITKLPVGNIATSRESVCNAYIPKRIKLQFLEHLVRVKEVAEFRIFSFSHENTAEVDFTF